MSKHLIKAVIISAITLQSHAIAAKYPINYPIDQTIRDNGRSLKSISLSSPSYGMQTVEVNQSDDLLLYHDLSNICFIASPGETVAPSFNWKGSWMHGYVYLDRDNDGDFAYTLGENSSIPEGSDVMSFSNYDSYNSVGQKTSDGNVGVNPPSFTIPADLAPGLYRMRYKVDWNSIDPGGNDSNGALHKQQITSNAGSITDVSIYVAESNNTLTISGDNGKVMLEDGSELTSEKYVPGKPLKVILVPDEGYIPTSLTVKSRSAINFPEGYMPASTAFKDSELEIPAILMDNDSFTIPANNMKGNVTIIARFSENSGEPTEGNYEAAVEGAKDVNEGITSITLNGASIDIRASERHHTETSSLSATVGDTLNLSVDYTGKATELNFYIDCNNNGVFSTIQGECFAKKHEGTEFTSVIMPEQLPTGVYRARIEAKDDCIVDFLIYYRNKAGNVRYDIINGMATTKRGLPLANTAPYGTEFTFKTKSMIEGFKGSKITVRVGLRLNGPEYIHGNKQWTEYEVDADTQATVEAKDMNGDVLIYGTYEETPDSKWTAVWSDEFDGNEIDEDKWVYCARQSSTWNKRIAQGDERAHVNKIIDGSYNSYAIATPEEFKTSDAQPIITGAIESRGKFHLTGGIIEAKIRSRAHRGSFPAFWMMPVDGSLGWPACGEIDIWEQIDDNGTTFHTVHSGWTKKTYGSVSQASPASGGTSWADQEQWHIYTLEWEKDEYLTWYKDGKKVFSYVNTHFSEGKYTEAVTWPFAKDFYIIINQSVGDGGWAADGDAGYEYLTEFDYVRAYQRKDALDYYSVQDGHVSGIVDVTMDNNDLNPDMPARYFNLQGLEVSTSNMMSGVYIEVRGNKSRKILIN